MGSGKAAAKLRRNAILASMLHVLVLVAALLLAVPLAVGPSLAANECGAGATITCTSGGNPYNAGISYSNANQSLTLGSGVSVNAGVLLLGTGNQSLTITSGASVSTTAFGDDAVYIGSSAGTATVRAAGSTVSTSNTLAWGYNLEPTGAIDAVVGNVIVGNANGLSQGVRGVSATSTNGQVDVTTGSVTARGVWDSNNREVFGIYASTLGSAAVNVNTTGGTVTVSGASVSMGIYAISNSGAVTITTASVTNSGNSGTGRPAGGIFGAAGGTGPVTIDSSAGTVSLTGATTSHAIAAQAGGAINITTANVSTVSGSANAVNATTSGAGTAGNVTINTTAGTLTTTGAVSRGIDARSTNATGGFIQITSGNISTSGTGQSSGIFASSTGSVTITAQGTIQTAGTQAFGIEMSAGGTGTITTAATITTTGNTSHGITAGGVATMNIDTRGQLVQTGGTGSIGINVDRRGIGTITTAVMINAGTISTTGTDARGINVINGTYSSASNGGAVTISAQSVTTTGNSTGTNLTAGSDGIVAYTSGAGANGRISIDTSIGATTGALGNVQVSGIKARGIRAESGRLNGSVGEGGGAITITAGNVTAEGESGGGITALTYGTGADGAITINVLGTVLTKGDGPAGTNGGPARGIEAVSWGGNVSVTTKAVNTEGDDASGVLAQSNGSGTVTINTAGGTVSTKGSGAAGVTATYGNGTTIGAVSVTTASVTTEGNLSNGVNAFADGPSASIFIDTTAGTVTTKGTNSAAINAIAYQTGPPVTSAAGTVVINAGNLRTEADGAVGISARAGASGMTITLSGNIVTLGVNSDGMSLSNRLTGLTKVTVNGTITATNSSADGINSSMIGSTASHEIIVNAAISATGASAHGILLTGTSDTVTVNANGSVRGNLTAINMQGLNSGNASVTNAGTLTGDTGTALTFAGNAVSTFTNTGTVNGAVQMGGGNDVVILGSTSVITGIVNGQGGADTIRFTGTASGTFDAAKATNFETAEKTGTGTWTLTGTSTTLPNIDVQAGRLAVNGTLTGLTTTIQSGAQLGGGGTLGAFSALTGSKVAPGNSIGTLTVATASFAAGSVYEVEISPGASDRLVVTGTATLNTGATVNVLPSTGTYTVGQDYLILDANLRVQQFSPTVTTNSAFLQFTLDQTRDANQVWLVVSGMSALTTVGQTPNQIATAGAIQTLGGGNPVFDALIPLAAPAARDALDQLSGEIHATVLHALVEDSRFPREAALDRLDAAFAAQAAGTYDPNWGRNVWARGFGGIGTVLGDGNAATSLMGSAGLLMGADGLIDDTTFIGVLVGTSAKGVSAPDRSSTANVNSYYLGLYGGARIGEVTVKFGGAVSAENTSTSRKPAVAGISQTLTSSDFGGTAQLFGEMSYAFAVDDAVLEPFGRVALVGATGNAYSETGGTAALAGKSSGIGAAIISVGLRASTDLELGDDMTVHVRGLAGLQQTVGTTPTATQTFAGSAPFTVSGAAGGGTALLLEAGLSTRLGDGLDFDIFYSGQIGMSGQSHAIKATLSGRF